MKSLLAGLFSVGFAASLAAGDWDVPPLSAEGLPPRTVMEYPAALEPVDWVQSMPLTAHLPPADWRQISEFLKEGYQSVAVNTLAQWDRVGPRAGDYDPSVVKEADAYLRRFVKMAHDAGAKAVFYLGPVQAPLQSAVFREKHRDWLRVNEDGSLAADYVNFRHPGVEAWVPEQLAWLAKEYAADGFWLDGFAPSALHTYDAETRRAFREYSKGMEIPARDKLDPRDATSRLYLQWHETAFVSFAMRMRQAVRAANPKAVLLANYSANRTWYMPGHVMTEYPARYAGAVDMPSVELYWDNPGDALYQQFVYAFTQGVTHDKGARTWVQPQAHGISGTPPAIEILLRCIEGAPWGVYAEFVEPTGQEQDMKTYAKFVKERAAWWARSEAVPFIGVVASEQTRALAGRDALPKYFDRVLGAFRAVFETHLPVKVLTEYDLENADLGGVRVVVLPDTRVLSDRAAEVIRRFVKAGGGLVAGRDAGMYDENFKQRPASALADLLMADWQGGHEVYTREGQLLLRLDDPSHPILKDERIWGQEETAWRNPSGPPPEHGSLDLIAGASLVKPRAGAAVLASFKTNESSSVYYPALIVSSHGAGRVVHAPAGFDQAMFWYPNTYVRALLANACKWAAGGVKPPLETDAPLALTVTYRRQPLEGRIIVHLLNDQSSYGRHSLYQKVEMPDRSISGPWSVREETLPIHDVRILNRMGKTTKATLQPGNIQLPLTIRDDGAASVVVPKVEIYSMVVFE